MNVTSVPDRKRPGQSGTEAVVRPPSEKQPASDCDDSLFGSINQRRHLAYFLSKVHTAGASGRLDMDNGWKHC